MIFVTILSMVAFIFSSSGDAWSQKNLSTVRIGIEAPAGTTAIISSASKWGCFKSMGSISS